MPEEDHNLRPFAEAFFNRFGAQTYPLDDELVVELPPDLVTVFGKPRLYLVFPGQAESPRELSPAEDLLIYGSRVFDQMLALLAKRGEATYLELPDQVSGESDQKPAFPLPLHNCSLLDWHVQIAQAQFYIFNFRTVYLSDEKQEEFMTVALDPAGQPQPDLVNALAQFALLRPPEQPRSVAPETLRRMLDWAGEVVRQQANERAADLEQAIRPRLQKLLLRLTTFYRRLAEEVDTGDPAQDEKIRAELQSDLRRKIGDELESHRLRVTLSPLSYAVAVAPVAHYRLTLATRQHQQILEVTQNLFTGQMAAFTCHHCQAPIDRVALCDRGHAVHPACFDTCQRCQRDVCRACGVETCAICAQPVCRECTAACAHCSHWLCAEHVATCAICARTYCTEYAFRCRWCEQTYCAGCETVGECETCRLALAGPVIETERIPASAANLKPARYEWRRAENQAFVIYIGQGRDLGSRLGGPLVMVMNSTGEVVHWRRLGWWPQLVRRFFRKR